MRGEEVINDDNASMFGMTRDWVLFGVTQKTTQEMFDMNTYPFVTTALWNHSKELIIMPIEEFHRLGDHLGDPKSRMSFLYSNRRTGSTLLGQILDKAPNVQVLAEPWAPLQILSMHQKGIVNKEEKLKRL